MRASRYASGLKRVVVVFFFLFICVLIVFIYTFPSTHAALSHGYVLYKHAECVISKKRDQKDDQSCIKCWLVSIHER